MSIVKPWSYEKRALAALHSSRQAGNATALVVMASGLGKTVVAAFDVKEFLRTKPGRVLFLCHQTDILEQAHETFEEVLGTHYSMGYLHAAEKDLEARILFATFQTMRGWLEKFSPKAFSYIVVDEGHHSYAPTYYQTLQYFKPKFLLGITATPDRTDLLDIRKIYGREVFSLPLEEALVEGYLTSVDYRLITDEIQSLKILDTPIGRLSISELNKTLFIPKRDKEVVKIIKEKCKDILNPRVMIFAPSIQYCDRLAALMPSATAIHYQLDEKVQRQHLTEFKQGKRNIIITVDKFNEGIDVPDVNVIVFLRSTASRIIFFQQLGRGLRKSSNKDKVLILDFVGNCERLEMIQRFWLKVEAGRQRTSGVEYKPKQQFTVSVGKVQFSEVAMQVLDVVNRIRKGYTKEVLIKMLQNLARDLCRTPTFEDIKHASIKGQIASFGTFRNHFGNYLDAIKAAGLSSQGRFSTKKVSRSSEQMLEDLKRISKDLGKIPNHGDVERYSQIGACASPTSYARRFGNIKTAVKLAGFSPKVQQPKRFSNTKKGPSPSVYTDDDLISYLVDLANQLGKVPTSRDVTNEAKRRKFPAVSVYVYRYKSWSSALREAGLIVEENE